MDRTIMERDMYEFLREDKGIYKRLLTIIRCADIPCNGYNPTVSEFVNNCSQKDFLRLRYAGKVSLAKMREKLSSSGIDWE